MPPDPTTPDTIPTPSPPPAPDLDWFEQFQNMVLSFTPPDTTALDNAYVFGPHQLPPLGPDVPTSLSHQLKEVQIGPQTNETLQDITTNYALLSYVDKKSSVPIENPLTLVDLQKLIRFSDDDAEAPAFLAGSLIYIQGIEISGYVRSINRTICDVGGNNTLNFVLENENDKFMWTEDNVTPVLYDTPLPPKFKAGEEVKEQMFAFKYRHDLNPRVRSVRDIPKFARWPLAPNKVIFQRRDPVRVFIRYPWRSPTGGNDDLWMPFFTGFVDTVSTDEDDINGSSKISINCVDIRQSILHKMRISTDPSSSLASRIDNLGFAPLEIYTNNSTAATSTTTPLEAQKDKQKQQLQDLSTQTDGFYTPSTAVFYDDVITTPFGHAFFPGLALEGAVQELLVFKPDNLRVGKGNRGVRNVQFGGIFHYDSVNHNRATAQKYLEQYHTFCLFGPKRRPWTLEECREVGSKTQTQGDFWPLNCRLWFLIPSQGSGPGNIADQGALSSSLVHATNWTVRHQVLQDLVRALDYQFYISPCGDMFCEMPLADFRPEDFGAYKGTFRVNKASAKAIGFTDEQDDPIAAMVIKRNLTQGASSSTGPNAEIADAAILTTIAFSPYIAAQYGMTVDTEQVPFLVEQDRLVAQQRALIEMQKRNSNVSALNIQFIYRPFLLPNRPLHHMRRDRMGTITTVDDNLDLVNGHGGTTANLHYIRTWTGSYHKAGDLNKQSKNPATKKELSITGTTIKLLEGPDLYGNSPDLNELKVFNTIMAGESLPTSARIGWGGAFAPDSGIYIDHPAQPLPPGSIDPSTGAPVVPNLSSNPNQDPNQGIDHGNKPPFPTGKQIADAGKGFIIAYVPFANLQKGLTKEQIVDYSANGLAIALLLEGMEDEDQMGFPKGVANANKAQKGLETLKALPSNMVIYFAIDTSRKEATTTAQNDNTVNYMLGVVSVLGKERVGMYAGKGTLDYVAQRGVGTYYWQASPHKTVDLSVSPFAHLVQYKETTLENTSIIVRLNRVLKPNYGQVKLPPPK